MAQNNKAKMKILYLLKFLQEETDADHGLTMTQIIERLAEYGINAERKSIYNDIKTLRAFDIDIKTYQRNPVEYAIERRDFSFEELSLMVDAIQSCRAITDRQAKMLITNIKTLATNHEQAKLDRRIHVVGRIKSKNESVLGTVDTLHEGIRLRHKVEFYYYKLGPDGKRYRTHHGKKHVVTPVAISYDDGFYYLSAWDDAHDNMVEYRLDRMLDVCVLENETATRNETISNYCFAESNIATFGRFSGPEVTVTLAVTPDKVEIITDRFGDAATFIENNSDETHARVRIHKSEQFFGWIAGMGKAVRIIAPKSLVKEYRAYLEYLLE